jgi:hypothetical protein
MDERITIAGGRFMLRGKPVWLCGANTPWHKWNDFGGEYDDAWWDTHFAALRENGLNATRVWINCNNDQGAVLFDDAGLVSGVSEKHFADLDLFFAAAKRHKLHIMATLLSFDHFKDIGARPQAVECWRKLILSGEGCDSYAQNYVAPFVERYKDNPYLWSIDLMNEPDWVHEEDFCGKLPWRAISGLFARCAAVIHERSSILVTVGMSFPKYHNSGEHCEGDRVSDDYLQGIYPSSGAFLDFVSPHYYDWIGEHYGVPFTTPPGEWVAAEGRPAVIGECPASGTKDSTLTRDYTNAFEHGWQGVFPWTSNGVDRCGGFDDVAPAASCMAELHPELIFSE